MYFIRNQLSVCCYYVRSIFFDSVVVMTIVTNCHCWYYYCCCYCDNFLLLLFVLVFVVIAIIVDDCFLLFIYLFIFCSWIIFDSTRIFRPPFFLAVWGWRFPTTYMYTCMSIPVWAWLLSRVDSQINREERAPPLPHPALLCGQCVGCGTAWRTWVTVTKAVTGSRMTTRLLTSLGDARARDSWWSSPLTGETHTSEPFRLLIFWSLLASLGYNRQTVVQYTP